MQGWGRPVQPVILVIEALFSSSYDRFCMRSVRANGVLGTGSTAYFLYRSIFVRMFDSQQRTQATQRTKLSLLVRTESDREYGRCPSNLSQAAAISREAPGNDSGQ